jgi:probable phosphoglycerate mutase
MTTTIILVRHGTTTWNHERRYQGQLDIPLDAQGEQEALVVAKRLKVEKVDAIYSSKLVRAARTAEIIATELGSGLSVTQLADLAEIDVGTWSGLLPAEAKQKFPEQFAAFERDKNLPRGEGESRLQLEQRTVSAIELIAQAHPGGSVVAVTHGAVIKVLAGWALQLPIEFQPNLHGVVNGSLTYLEVQLEPRRTRLAAYNLTSDGGSPLSVEMSEG